MGRETSQHLQKLIWAPHLSSNWVNWDLFGGTKEASSAHITVSSNAEFSSLCMIMLRGKCLKGTWYMIIHGVSTVYNQAWQLIHSNVNWYSKSLQTKWHFSLEDCMAVSLTFISPHHVHWNPSEYCRNSWYLEETAYLMSISWINSTYYRKDIADNESAQQRPCKMIKGLSA